MGFWSLFINKKTAATKLTTTNTKTPIITVPFAHDTKGRFKKLVIFIIYSVKIMAFIVLNYDKNQVFKILHS